MAVIVTIAISYISIHTVIFIATFCLIASTTSPSSSQLLSDTGIKAFFLKLRQTFAQRPTLAAFTILHYIDVGLDFGVMIGWYVEQNTFRKTITYNGSLLLFMIILHTISKITSSLYIYGVTREILPTILQFFDLDIYYEMYFDQRCTQIITDIKIEQLYRSFAVMQSFPIAIIQTYLLVAYQMVDKDQFLDNSDFTHISFTFISLLSSLLFMISLQVNHDAKFMNSNDRWMNIGMPKWLIRVLFRTFELLSRVLLLTYVWILYGIIAVICVLTMEWFFQIYNHYRKDRYDNSSEHSIRMWRKQNKFFLWPLVMDEIISFWNFDWKLPVSNPPKQRTFDVIDIIQGWTLASFFYGNKNIRKSTKERPTCDCLKAMDEYWTRGYNTISEHSTAHINMQSLEQRKAFTPVETDSQKKRDFEDRSSTNGLVMLPKCSSCDDFVSIKSHYFRCPTFLQSGNIEDLTEKQKITKHGRYLCIECGYGRMTYLPFLFVFSRAIFTWIYVCLLTVFAVLNVMECDILCIDSGDLNNKFHKTAHKSLIFLFGMGCNVLAPLFFILILTTKQMKGRKIEIKSVSGKVIEYAKKFEWNEVYELIRHEDCDVNEVDRIGRSPLLYAAISHNFQVIRDLQQFGADMTHIDINSCGITHYLNKYEESNDSDGYDMDKTDKLTGPTRAVKNGGEADIHLCIELGCDLNKTDGYGHTPLLIACKEREINVLRVLINEANQHGPERVDLNMKDKLGRTAVIIVTQYGYDDLLEILLSEAQNIDVTQRDNEGISAFEHAISCNQKKCAKLIHNYKKQNNITESDPNMTEQKETDMNANNENIPEQKTQMYGNVSTRSSNAIVPKQIELPMQNNDQLQGDVKNHPIATTPHSELGTPSPIALHESDSIDRRVIRAFTVDGSMMYKQNGNDEDSDEMSNDRNYAKTAKTKISILVTDTSAQ